MVRRLRPSAYCEGVVEAVLFDWGDTLFRSAFDDGIFLAGWEAGMAAIGRDGLPDHRETAARFRDHYLPLIYAYDAVDEVDYEAMIRELLDGFGHQLDDEELARFVEAEHAQEIPARLESACCHDLLDGLRARSIRLGLVSNVCDPPRLVRDDLRWMELDRRFDTVVFSSEVGRRKPDPTVFRAALTALGTGPREAVFVGDRRYDDMRGAKELGMATVLATWFRVDDDPRGIDPDFVAAEPAAVFGILDQLAARAA
jgi:HAD superfamily hydrolase (TIGR01549 family)